MIEYKDYISFNILGHEVNVISDETAMGRNTVVEIDNSFYYMGDEYPTVSTAIFAWQEFKNCELNSEELRQVLIDNDIISSAV